ncbi:MAG: helix-turn-helix transcriptional regulator [Clostridiales bacterium]|jgi:DNA-binding Xre family transcriptional regulator|nr:helix-turn-helix transcriptional regulator [Clostridiales bacterium]
MTISEKIKVLCVRAGISVAELSRRLGQSPANFNAKLKRGKFSVGELETIAETLGCTYENYFVWTDGSHI